MNNKIYSYKEDVVVDLTYAYEVKKAFTDEQHVENKRQHLLVNFAFPSGGAETKIHEGAEMVTLDQEMRKIQEILGVKVETKPKTKSKAK